MIVVEKKRGIYRKMELVGLQIRFVQSLVTTVYFSTYLSSDVDECLYEIYNTHFNRCHNFHPLITGTTFFYNLSLSSYYASRCNLLKYSKI